jgi:hypothetical protein
MEFELSNGKRYRAQKETIMCEGCAFRYNIDLCKEADEVMDCSDAEVIFIDPFGVHPTEESLQVEEKPTEQSSSALDVQISGSHYKALKIQPVEFIHANNIPFIEGNVIKYICRWRSKNGIKDLEKVKHYVDLLIELEKLKGQ